MKLNRGKIDDTLAAMFSNPQYRTNYLFYAHLISQCSIKIDYEMPAAAGVAFMRDHYNLYINPELFDKETLLIRLGILKHEMLHILNKHVQRTECRNHYKFNISTDCAINQLIDLTHLPDYVITPTSLSKLLKIKVPVNESAEFYYDLLKDDLKEGLSTLDDHSTWEKSEGDKDLQSDLTRKMIEKSQEETYKQRGTVPGQYEAWLDLHSRKSNIDWKKVLKGVTGEKRVGKIATIKRKNRRFPERKDLKGYKKDYTFDLLVIGDVSGSMSDSAVIQCFAAIKEICDITQTPVKLIQIDTFPREPEELSKNQKLITRKGSGGTLLYPAIEKAKECKLKYDAIVVVTDGGVSSHDIQAFNALRKRVIWLIEPTGVILDGMNDGRMRAYKLDP